MGGATVILLRQHTVRLSKVEQWPSPLSELCCFQPGEEAAMPDGNDLFEIMQTTRSMRRLKPDPVPDELIGKILEAGSCAANGGNTQRWRFLVVKDPKIKQAVQVWYKRAFDEVVGPRYATSAPPPGVSPERYKRQHAAVEYLTEHFHEAPVWIVACIDEGKAAPTRWSGASIYPAVQNMLLAARALGLGSTLTTRHLLYAKEAEAALSLPEGVHSYAILPIGYPMGRFGPVGRGSLADIVYQDKWGQRYAALS
jgi:nitroreductase